MSNNKEIVQFIFDDDASTDPFSETITKQPNAGISLKDQIIEKIKSKTDIKTKHMAIEFMIELCQILKSLQFSQQLHIRKSKWNQQQIFVRAAESGKFHWHPSRNICHFQPKSRNTECTPWQSERKIKRKLNRNLPKRKLAARKIRDTGFNWNQKPELG